MRVYEQWEDARAEAQRIADEQVRPMGVERMMEYGTREVFLVRYIPVDPAQRFGCDARCEVVSPMAGWMP